VDPLVPQANPKAFFGYSDNTNLLVYLWDLGIIGFYGGSTMVHLARPGRLHPMTLESMRRALFEPGTVHLSPAAEMTDENPNWEDPPSLDHELPMRPGAGWTWAGKQRAVTGPSRGGWRCDPGPPPARRPLPPGSQGVCRVRPAAGDV
jgi:muramoyltetrapeptide carboxypeptidase LdcA involved in peptidoglycan recycling